LLPRNDIHISSLPALKRNQRSDPLLGAQSLLVCQSAVGRDGLKRRGSAEVKPPFSENLFE
jgi:hypothetical protein